MDWTTITNTGRFTMGIDERVREPPVMRAPLAGSEGDLASTPMTMVIVCDHAYVSGGLAKVAISSACALRRRGHRVIFFSAVGPVAPELEAHGVDVICLNQPDMLGDSSRVRAAARAIWNSLAASKLEALLAKLPLGRSIVHIHGWSKALSPSVLAVARDSALPVVETLHDYVRHCPNGALYDYVAQTNCERKPMSLGCVSRNCDARNFGHKLWRVSRHAVLGHLARDLGENHYIVISEHQARIVRAHLPDPSRVHFVPNLVDVEDQGPAPVIDNDAFLFVGRLSEEKGADLLAEAGAITGSRLVFVGDGPARDTVAGKSRATFTGWLDKPALMREVRKARALVFPSRWYETFGLTVAEALANGVPVIVSDNTAAAELVAPFHTGLRFKSGDVWDLARCLDLLNEPGMAARLGQAAYEEYWRSPLTDTRHVARLEKTYADIVTDAITGHTRTAPAAYPSPAPASTVIPAVLHRTRVS